MQSKTEFYKKKKKSAAKFLCLLSELNKKQTIVKATCNMPDFSIFWGFMCVCVCMHVCELLC